MRFVDTSFWIALESRSDLHSADARTLLESNLDDLVTTNQVLGETWTWFARRRGHDTAVKVCDRMRRSRALAIVHVDERIGDASWRWLRRHDERTYSFVDATSFAVMRERRIREALAFDADFSAAGFVELRP